MNALLSVQNLNVAYRGIHALRDVGFELHQGEVVALLGANGAGKSSLLRAISGLVTPVSGTITFDNASLLGRPPAAITRLGIGHVPEGRRVFARMTVRENLELGDWRGKNTQRELTAIFEMFPRLAERASQQAGLLSGGEQQMLALGRALMGSPRLLLLDEPSLGLAPQVIALIFASLGDIQRNGTSIVLVEQNVRAALTLASRGYVLENGRMLRTGPADELLQDPAIIDAYLGGE